MQPPGQEFQWLEFFAGVANCTLYMRRAGYVSGKFDILYCDKMKQGQRKSNWHDLLSPSGFALLRCWWVDLYTLSLIPPWKYIIGYARKFRYPISKKNFPTCVYIIIFNLGSYPRPVLPPAVLRLALVFILKQKTSDCIAWFAIKCSSFTGVNRGTSKRSACNSIGDRSVYSVGMSNALLERTPMGLTPKKLYG